SAPSNSRELRELFQAPLIGACGTTGAHGAAMSTELDHLGIDHIGLDRIGGGGRFGWTGIGLSQWTEASQTRLSRTRLLMVPFALLAAAGVWLVMSGSRGGVAGSG